MLHHIYHQLEINIYFCWEVYWFIPVSKTFN